MAAKSLKGFGWFLCGVLVAPPCYLVSSWVATERARVESLQRAIVSAQREIRDLETEFQTRSSIAQLERWNGDVLALAAPRPEQYVAGEEALAQLHVATPGEATVQQAAFIVPAGLYDNDLHRANQQQLAAASPAVPATSAPDAPAAKPATAAPKRSAAPIALASVATTSPERALAAPSRRPTERKAQAVAMLDDTLLSDRTLGDLARGAKSETVKRR
ncbi:hypothetical protein OKW76_14820 [Sphingomonas sp. S1-29]|uniref:hypothetical protein n=1 Tax=Sphingomonas sp. S1-29 TaxID=2991074 RepID=UPI00224093F9|nr:hypothetical protein [Sphingomonas sp. S1-29]UZK69271.1 hypothetical protein OKW76_14820 [Sphingomonas sp. S1-29]